MPQSGKQNLFNIEQLKSLLESGYCVLTPNSRMARDIGALWNQQQLDRGHSSWHTVPVAPLEGWLQEKWQEATRLGLLEPMVPATAGQLSELWQEVIASHERETKGYSLIRPTAAADQASRARDTLLRWQVDINLPHHRQSFELDEDCATFFSWQALFVQKLAVLGMTTTTDSLLGLLSCAKAMPRCKVALVGFDDIAPLLRSCIKALAEDVVEIAPSGQPGQCKAYQYPDKRTELAAVAHWAKELTQSSPGCRIGVILPNMKEDRLPLEYLLRREFDCLGANYTSLPVNFSTGIALDRVAVVRDALLMLSANRQRVAVADVVALMRSRFHSQADTNSKIAMQFIRRLFDMGTEFVDAGDLRYRASRPEAELELGQVLMAMTGMRDLRKPALPSVWADRFSQVLDLWGWPGNGPIDSIEYQQLTLWHSLLDEYCAYDAVCSAMAYEDALSLLLRCCARQMSQPQTPDSNVQVLGLLEAAGLSFDYVWICDMQANNWPAAARPNPFIPIRLQRDMNMPNASAEREWHFASGLMAQYISSASLVIASYAQQRDGVPEKPSALLEGFSQEQGSQGEVLNPQWVAMHEKNSTDRIEDSQAPPVGAQELEALGGGSGLIEDQSQCPFRAFARRRLHINPLGEASVAMSAAERGSLLHDALYHLWGAIVDSSVLAAMNEAEANSAVHNAVNAAVEALPSYKRGGMGQAYFALESGRLCSLLQEWLMVERQRSAFKVRAREEKISLQLGPLKISLRADRIDELPDGASFIIDYKSGVSSPRDWLGERPAKPQLLLYGLAVQETVAGLAFAQVRTRDCKYTGAGQIDVAAGVQSDIEKLVKDKMPARDWEDLAALWQDNLERLAGEFVAGNAQVDPLHSTSCTYCGLQALCRVAEL